MMLPFLTEIIWNENTIAIVCVFSVPLAAILGTMWYKATKVRSENDLKRSMVERGMSAQDIERVMQSGRSSEH
ncbi:MAG TPA: hypothetical protein VGM03_14925 [Phycisphaerae bacterium]|jgi:ABC-type bacteriocin/lantibiotic exporter with double-glycine peptidase domain